MKEKSGLGKMHLRLKGDVRRVPRAPRRWRVDIVNENTLSRVIRVRFTGIRAYLALLASIAAVASLVIVFFTFTPVGKWIWGERSLRDRYVEMSLRLDSINNIASIHHAYAANIAAILNDSVVVDSVASEMLPALSDTLMAASEAERQFVEKFESERRFNLSVLSPIAAEGMIFESPVARVGEGGPVMSVYRGTVIGQYVSPDGLYTIVVQHPNDFISSYGGLNNIYVSKGAKVIAGQRIGAAENEPVFELWRNGASLDPTKYIQFPIPPTIDK